MRESQIYAPFSDPNDEVIYPKKKNDKVENLEESYFITPMGLTQVKSLLEVRNYYGLEAVLFYFFKNTYVAEFAIMLFPSCEKGIIEVRMLGEKVLKEPKRVDIGDCSLKKALYQFKALTLDDLDELSVVELENLINQPLISFLCVPLKFHLAPQRASVLVCLANKRNSQVVSVHNQNIHFDISNMRYAPFTESDAQFLRGTFDDTFAQYDREVPNPRPNTVVHILSNILLQWMNDPAKFLHIYAFQLKNFTNASNCAIYMLNTKSRILIPLYFDKSPDEDIVLAARNSQIGYFCNLTLCKSLRNLQLINARHHTLTPVDLVLDKLTKYTTQNMIACPIIYMNRITYGVLEISNKRDGTNFNLLDEELTKNLAHDVSIFIRRWFVPSNPT